MKQDKIAIIGGTGFIGSNLAHYLVKKNYFPLVIGRSINNIYNIRENLLYESLDIFDTEQLIEKVKGYNVIIWLVDNLVPNSNFISSSEVFLNNTLPIVNFLEGIEKYNQSTHFIYFSSGGVVYGDPDIKLPICENHTKNPKSVYGLSKSISEQYIKFIISKSINISATIIRPSNVYGEGQNFQKAQGIIGFGFNAITNNYTLDLFGGGDVIRDFIHVNDVAEALWLLLNSYNNMSKFEVFNVGSNHGHSIFEVLKMMESISGKNLNFNFLPSRSIDCEYNILNCSKIEKQIGWKPKIYLLDGLKSIWSNKINTNSI
jgi:UDP-glucose 4-epimerase